MLTADSFVMMYFQKQIRPRLFRSFFGFMSDNSFVYYKNDPVFPLWEKLFAADFGVWGNTKQRPFLVLSHSW
jgi:hypothetical protein